MTTFKREGLLLRATVFVLLCLFNAARAEPANVRATYDVQIGGIRVASVSDQLQFRSDGTYEFHSIFTPVAILSWLVDPIARTSEGIIDDRTGRLLVEKYVLDKGSSVTSKIVDRLSGTIFIEQGNFTKQITVGARGDDVTIHDSLTMPYEHYAMGSNADRVKSYWFLDDRHLKSHEWKRANDTEWIEYAGKMVEAVRYDRYKHGVIRSSVWFATQLHKLPCLATFETRIGVTIGLLLTDFNIQSSLNADK